MSGVSPKKTKKKSKSKTTGASEQEREQALRDYKVTIEYKHLKSHAPGGVYLIPSLQDSLRSFVGIIFVRRGWYTNGIFKFTLDLPDAYNAPGTYPVVKFTRPVFNPYVDPETHKMELAASIRCDNWDPAQHYLVTVLTVLKKIFYTKQFDNATANPEARRLLEEDLPAYRRKVDDCVRQSQLEVYENAAGAAKFTQEELSHRVLRDLLKANVKDPAAVSKTALLSMISKASTV